MKNKLYIVKGRDSGGAVGWIAGVFKDATKASNFYEAAQSEAKRIWEEVNNYAKYIQDTTNNYYNFCDWSIFVNAYINGRLISFDKEDMQEYMKGDLFQRKQEFSLNIYDDMMGAYPTSSSGSTHYIIYIAKNFKTDIGLIL